MPPKREYRDIIMTTKEVEHIMNLKLLEINKSLSEFSEYLEKESEAPLTVESKESLNKVSMLLSCLRFGILTAILTPVESSLQQSHRSVSQDDLRELPPPEEQSDLP